MSSFSRQDYEVVRGYAKLIYFANSRDRKKIKVWAKEIAKMCENVIGQIEQQPAETWS